MRIYENPEKTSENRLPPRSAYIPGGCSEYILLNGQWRFAYYDRDIDVPQTIMQWDTIPVPGCWQLHGYDSPNYTNQNFPFPVDMPYVPDDNPCGVYQREFQLAEKWGKVYFVLEGVSSCAFVSVNGGYVGFTQGSHLFSEFDITDYVNQGANTVEVLVHKWCCGSYLEDQDFFRYNGIFRDVYLLQRPEGHITDVDMIPNDKAISLRIPGSAQVQIWDGEILMVDTLMQDAFSFALNLDEKDLKKLSVEALDEALSKVGAGEVESGKYDVIFPSDYMLQRMADEGLLYEFDVAESVFHRALEIGVQRGVAEMRSLAQFFHRVHVGKQSRMVQVIAQGDLLPCFALKIINCLLQFRQVVQPVLLAGRTKHLLIAALT